MIYSGAETFKIPLLKKWLIIVSQLQIFLFIFLAGQEIPHFIILFFAKQEWLVKGARKKMFPFWNLISLSLTQKEILLAVSLYSDL